VAVRSVERREGRDRVRALGQLPDGAVALGLATRRGAVEVSLAVQDRARLRVPPFVRLNVASVTRVLVSLTSLKTVPSPGLDVPALTGSPYSVVP
jgi:hypothetical protein